MKTIKYLNIAASVLMLAACAKEELVPSEELIPVSESTTVTFVASDGTKTVLGKDLKTTSWDKTENVLLWEGETQLTISDNDKSYSDDGKKLTITKEVTSLESTFYSIVGPEGEGNVTKTSAAVLATQNPAQASFDPKAEILVAQPATCDEGNKVDLRYNRPVAITVATLKNLEEGEEVKSVKITADKNLTGNVNFTYDGTNVKAEMDGKGNTITCNYTTNNTVVQGDEGEGYIFPVYFISLNAEVMVFEFEVCTDKHKYYRKITRPEDSPIVLNDNRVAQFGFMLENADKADAEGEKFVKVTSEPTDWSGEYLLVYEASNNNALCWTGVDAASCYVEADIAEGEIADKPDNAVTLTIATMTDEKGNEGYAIQVNGGTNNGKYISGKSGDNVTNFGTQTSLNTLSYDNSVIITSNTSVMRYNNASNGKWFRYFKSSTYSDQQPVQLYKKTPGGYGKYILATPKKIQYSAETKKITWDAVDNAEKYTISLNGGEPVECSSNEYEASSLSAEYYYATVVAYPSAEKESTYQASSEGTNKGWFKIGDPKMPVLVANDITLNITSTTITASWENDVNATNGYIAEIWSRKTVESGKTDEEGNPETTTVDDELISKNENVTEGTITFKGLNAGTDYHIKVTTKAAEITDDRGTRAYANSDAANKYPKTSSVYTIAQIFNLESSTVACEVENAVIYAKGESCYLVYDGTGYIMVNTSAGDYNVGDKLTISGKTEKSNNQKRFDSTTTIVEETGTSTVSHPTENTYDGEFTYAKYVKIIGKTSISGGVVSIADIEEHSLKLIDNAGLEGNQYVTVTGYLTHVTTAGYINMIVVDKQINTITVAENAGHEWDSDSVAEKSFTISTDNNTGWTYEPNNTAEWTVIKSDNNTLKVSPNEINASTTSGKSLTITLTHSGNTMLTTSFQCSQKPKHVVYEKYTDNLTEGYYLITYENGAMKNSVKSDRLEYSEITPTSDKVTDPAVSIVWKIAKSDNYWTIYNESVQKYAASTGTKSQAGLNDSGTDAKSLWTATMSNGTFEFVNKQNSENSVNAYLRKNDTYGFACYAKGTGGDLTLYKLEDGKTTPTITTENKTINTNGSVDVSEMFTSNSTGAITYSVDSGNLNPTTHIFTTNQVGTYTVTFSQEATDTYKAATKTATIIVTEPIWVLQSIAITTSPTNIEYEVGEKFNPAGMIVTGTFKDETNVEKSWEVIGYTYPTEDLTEVTTSVEISYTYKEETRTANQDITVKADTTTWNLKSIAITTPPSKTEYKQGETLDLAEMVVTATYSDAASVKTDKQEVVSSWTSNPANGATLSTVGDVTVTVSFTDGETKTATQTVKVVAAATPKELTLTCAQWSNTSYNTSEATFEVDGITIGYINAMKNGSNGTPTNWAKNQVIQTKSGGYIYNKTSLGKITSIKFSIVTNTNSFTLNYGNTTDCSSSIESSGATSGTENVTYTKYANKTTTSGQTTTANTYTFDLSDEDAEYFKFACGNNSIYILKIEITYAK